MSTIEGARATLGTESVPADQQGTRMRARRQQRQTPRPGPGEAMRRSIDSVFAGTPQVFQRLALVMVAALVLAGTGTAVAQEGHPLKGSWIGTWAGNTVHGN